VSFGESAINGTCCSFSPIVGAVYQFVPANKLRGDY